MTDQPTLAELEAAGFYDSTASDAAAQRALIEYLLGLGATLEDFEEAGREQLPVIASNISLWGGDRERLTAAEMTALTGTDLSLLARAWRAAGFPEPTPETRIFARRDVELFGILQGAAELFGEDVAIQLVRVLGAAAARVADAAVSAFIVNVGPSAMEQDPSGLALARANADSTAMLDGLTHGFDVLLRHHLERGFRPLPTPDAVPDIDLVQRSVGFADLVESTAWAHHLELPELSKALNTFEAVASELVVDLGGRVVKFLGDEIMFVAHDPAGAVEVALGLVEEFSNHRVLPPVRAGIATGGVLARDGDYSGPVVNLAARAVKLAQPSSVFVDEATRAALSDVFVCIDAGSSELKGFEDPVPLYRIIRND